MIVVPRLFFAAALLCAAATVCAAADAPAGSASVPASPAPESWAPESGKLLATAGVTQLEGAGGGGLVPWALITGYGTRDAVGANAHYTYVHLPDFDLQSGGIAVGLYDRLELSATRQWFDTGHTGGKLGLGNGYSFDQTILGAKLRVVGDAVYDQDSWLPQIAAGVQYKTNNRGTILSAVGARASSGVDVYLAATKLFLSESLLLNGTVRATRANQFGLLGFGGDRHAGYSAEFEASAAYLLSRSIALGGEYRTKPDNLRFAREDDAWDLFGVWFLSKNLSSTLAYVQLGRIATQRNQGSFYLSLQAGF